MGGHGNTAGMRGVWKEGIAGTTHRLRGVGCREKSSSGAGGAGGKSPHYLCRRARVPPPTPGAGDDSAAHLHPPVAFPHLVPQHTGGWGGPPPRPPLVWGFWQEVGGTRSEWRRLRARPAAVYFFSGINKGIWVML